MATMDSVEPMDITRFRFVALGATAPQSAISCDGVVEGAALHLSHWRDNRTPAALKADTSTEIAMNFVASPLAEQWKHSVVVNNHFDTDGVLSIATLLHPALAAEHRALFLSAAAAGDFQEWPDDADGLKLDAAILALGAKAPSERAAYALVLNQLPELVRTLEQRAELWGPAWAELSAGLAAVNSGAVSVARNGWTTIVRHSRAFWDGAEPGAAPRELPGAVIHRLHPDATARWILFAVDEHHFHARLEWPRHAWADTVVRRKPDTVDAAALARDFGPAWRVCAAHPGTTGLIETSEPVCALPELPPF